MPTLRHKSEPQSDSKNVRQLDLLNSRAAMDQVSIDLATIRRQPSLQAAIGLCIAASGKDRKQIYTALDIDAATFSRIESGQAYFPPNKLVALMKLCGNQAPRIWLDEACGHDSSSMRPHRDGDQRRIAELEQENHDLKRLLRLKAEIEGR